jgi:hypothetical protein
VGEILLASATPLHVPYESVSVGRTQNFRQQVRELFVGGTGNHGLAPKAFGWDMATDGHSHRRVGFGKAVAACRPS